MRVESAIALVGQIVYKQGWSFEASDHRNRYEDSICVKITYPAVDSGREAAKDGYSDEYEIKGGAYAHFPIMVAELDEVGLDRVMLLHILTIEEHEAREFYRREPTLWAPFHPHQLDGIRRWLSTSKIAKLSKRLTDDLRFGVS